MTAGSTDNTMEWQDKKRRLWLMGLVFPTLVITVTPFIWAMNQLGWYPAAAIRGTRKPTCSTTPSTPG